MRDGFLNLLKPPGMTSSDAVVMVRKTLPRGAKVGHMGTLDPEASGVLPIGIGKAARLFDYVSDKEKGYRAEIRIGVETDTQDATGRITGRGGLVTAEQLQGVLPQFEGDIEQIPSQYSAIKVSGKKLYQTARAGESIEIPKRTVHIESVTYVAQTAEDRFLIDVACGRGTYIRTLCHDIGKALGTCAHMAFLLRTKSGVFELENAVTPEEYLQSVQEGEPKLLPCDAPIRHIPAVHLGDNLEHAVRNGNPIRLKNWKNPPQEGSMLRVYLGEQFAGMGQVKDGEIRFRCMLLGGNES